MSQSDNSFEPNVIDDEMLQKAVEEQWPEDIRKLAKAEGIDFKEVMELQLSFRSEYQNTYIYWRVNEISINWQQ